MKKEKKLKLAASAPVVSLIEDAAPKTVGEKLNLPTLIKFGNQPGNIAVGKSVQGTLIGVIENFTGDKKMKGSWVIQLEHASGENFLIPLTGTIRGPFKRIADVEDDEETGKVSSITIKKEFVGRLFRFTRRTDSTAKKYGGKPMFSVDVEVLD